MQTVGTHNKGFECQWTTVSDSNLSPSRHPSLFNPPDQWKLGLLTLRPYPFNLHISSLLSNPFRATEIVSSGLFAISSASYREPIKLFGSMPNIITIENHHNSWDSEVSERVWRLAIFLVSPGNNQPWRNHAQGSWQQIKTFWGRSNQTVTFAGRQWKEDKVVEMRPHCWQHSQFWYNLCILFFLVIKQKDKQKPPN